MRVPNPDDTLNRSRPGWDCSLNLPVIFRVLQSAPPMRGLCRPGARVSQQRTRPSMTGRLLTALAVLSAAGLAAPGVGRAQTFKVEKFDIKGEGGTDYVAVEAATGRVFVSRSTHVMVVDGATGKVLRDIPNTPGVHGAGIATKAGHGFTTNGGHQTVTM